MLEHVDTGTNLYFLHMLQDNGMGIQFKWKEIKDISLYSYRFIAEITLVSLKNSALCKNNDARSPPAAMPFIVSI